MEKQQKENKTIAEKLKEHINSGYTLSGPGGTFNGEDFISIQKVLSGEVDNFIIFNNGGGRPFHIWIYDNMKKASSKNTLKGFKKFVDSQKGYIFMKKIEGVETILQDFPNHKQRDVWSEIANVLAG